MCIRSLFFFFIVLFIYFWLCWVFVSVRGLSLVAASGGHSSSRCAGLSLLPPVLLRNTGSRRAGSVIVAHRPSCSAACGIFPNQGSNPCPLHWQADSQPLRHQGSPIRSLWADFLGSLSQGFPQGQNKGIGLDCSLTQRLDWGRIHWPAHMVVLHSLRTVALGSQFLTSHCPETALSSLTDCPLHRARMQEEWETMSARGKSQSFAPSYRSVVQSPLPIVFIKCKSLCPLKGRELHRAWILEGGNHSEPP